jgi:hypothetical protein
MDHKKSAIKCIFIVVFFLIAFKLGYESKSVHLFPISKFLNNRASQAENKIKIPEPNYFYANDFILRIEKLTTNPSPHMTAGILETSSGQFREFDQLKATNVLQEYGVDLKKQNSNSEVVLEKNGGLKRIFMFRNNLIGLFTLKNKEGNCYYASLINLTNKNEFFKGHCLPDSDNLEFASIGGGHTELNGKLLIAIGTPASDAEELSSLAQNRNSPYGKILAFSVDDILKNTNNEVSKRIPIYSMGHRNP